jgi:site-specific recombinase XerD
MNISMRLFKRNGWYYAGFHRGKEKALGTKEEVLAKEIYRELKAEYLKGKLFRLEDFKKITLSQFHKTYIEEARSGMATKTVRQDDLALRLLEDVIGSMTQVRAITVSKIDDFKRACLARKVTPNSVNSYLRHIKAALTYAFDQGIIEKKPKIKMVPTGEALPHVLSPEKIQTLLAKAKETDLNIWLYFMFCLWTGSRRMEALKVKCQDICINTIIKKDEKGVERAVKKGHCKLIGKGNRERIVPLLPPLIEVIEPYLKDIGPLFPQEHADTYTHKFRKVAKDCGITDHHLHDLRHTAATFMLKSGISLPVVQQILGHAQISTTQIYAQVLDEMKQTEMAKLKFE